MTAEYFQRLGFENYWQISFLILGLIVMISSVALFFVPEKSSYLRTSIQKKKIKNFSISLR